MQDDWGGVRFFTILGAKSYVTMSTIREGVVHPLTLVFMVFAVATLVLFDVHDYSDLMPVGGTVLLWTTCIATLFAFYISIIGALVLLSRRRKWIFVFLPAVGVIAMSLNTVLTMYTASMLTGGQFVLSDVWGHLPLNIAGGLIFESMYSIFALPLVGSHRVLDKPSVPPVARSISLGGQVFNVNAIQLISSQDHYLEVKSKGGTVLLRARLSDAMSQLSEDTGISPHRSHWVASSHIERVGGKSGSKTLVLNDGAEVPIARSRVSATQEWLDHNVSQDHRH